jgi:hypothetical protein
MSAPCVARYAHIFVAWPNFAVVIRFFTLLILARFSALNESIPELQSLAFLIVRWSRKSLAGPISTRAYPSPGIVAGPFRCAPWETAKAQRMPIMDSIGDPISRGQDGNRCVDIGSSLYKLVLWDTVCLFSFSCQAVFKLQI